ncbi:hypothetical protein ACF0H5_005940 [Mactra antiquata]
MQCSKETSYGLNIVSNIAKGFSTLTQSEDLPWKIEIIGPSLKHEENIIKDTNAGKKDPVQV